MARTKLTAKANYNRRKADYRQGRVRPGLKNIEGRIKNRDTKNPPQIIPQSQNIEVKKMVVRQMLLNE